MRNDQADTRRGNRERTRMQTIDEAIKRNEISNSTKGTKEPQYAKINSANVEEDSGKAEINLFYNETKAGVDVLDQLCHTYSVQRKTKRWPLAYFMNLLNVAGVAAYVIWRNLTGRVDEPSGRERKKFLGELSAQMTLPQIQRRSLVGLSIPHKELIRSVIGKDIMAEAEAPSNEPPSKKIKRRCYMCPSRIDRKVKQVCNVCENNVCNEHSTTVLRCNNCSRKKVVVNSSDSE